MKGSARVPLSMRRYVTLNAVTTPATSRRHNAGAHSYRGDRHRAQDRFTVCVLGHLRPVKDPFRTALAARLLPAESRIRVVHVGAALSEEMAELARAEAAENPRYRYVGELPRWKAYVRDV